MRVNPSRRTTFATVFREMITPSSWRSARIFGDPNTPSEAPWDQTTFCSNRSIRIARSDGFRASQASLGAFSETQVGVVRAKSGLVAELRGHHDRDEHAWQFDA